MMRIRANQKLLQLRRELGLHCNIDFGLNLSIDIHVAVKR